MRSNTVERFRIEQQTSVGDKENEANSGDLAGDLEAFLEADCPISTCSTRV